MNSRCKMLRSVLLVLLGLVVIAADTQAFAQGNTWATKSSMLAFHLSGVAGVIDGRLYVSGGHDGGTVQGLEVYDPSTDSWTAKTAAPTRVFQMAGGVINGKLYVAGGILNQSTTVTNVLQVYDPLTDTWATKNHMPTARALGGGGAVIAGKLYVVGGTPCVCDIELSTLEVYDPATDTWITKSPMLTGRFAPGAAAIDGKLYVLGGLIHGGHSINTLEVYDPVTDTWTTKASMPTARQAMAVGVINGQLHAVGGFLETVAGFALNTHEVYDPATDTWATKAPMPTPRFSLVADVINSLLYAAGGASSCTGACPVVKTLEVYTPPTTNQPPVAICRNVTVNTDPGTCSAATVSVNNGSFDPDGTISSSAQLPAGPYGKGTTNITLTVTDNQGASNSCTGTVTVVDQQAPILTCPVPQVIDATGPGGAVATFSPTVSDNCSGAIAVSCTPASGSTFPIGSTSVSCSATDGSANSSSCGFTVSVTAAAGQISNLIGTVQTFNLKQGIANSLDAKLQNILAALNAAQGGSVASTCNQLNAFINETQAQAGKALTVDQANQLITSANRIKAVIGCP